MLTVMHPTDFPAERAWIIQVVLGEFLGLDFRLRATQTAEIRIEAEGRVLAMPDNFFVGARDAWLDSASLPRLPLATWDTLVLGGSAALVELELPVIYGDSEFSVSERRVRLPLDVFGSAFMLLSRYEECLPVQRDVHDRFPAAASVAQRAGFLDRPIIDEYTEVLWAAMHRLWPQLQRRSHSFNLFFSCDVDIPFDFSVISHHAALRRLAADIVVRRSATAALDTVAYTWRRHRRGLAEDRMWRFDSMMDACESANVSGAFYFLVDHCHPRDCDHYWGHPTIDGLLRDIHSRGHEIGLHASYTTFDDPEQTRSEFSRLIDTCDQLGIQQTQWGGRQHYLRWAAAQTWRNWADAGLNYDTTLTFAESPGFRCGTCHAYPVFDITKHESLDLVERPLLVMDATLLAPQYLALDDNDARYSIDYFKSVAKKFNGEFSILWHNSRLLNDEQRELFTYALAN